MNKRTNSDDVIIYKGSHQTVILTHADFPSDEEFEKWYHWSRPVRAVCVTAINLVPEERPVQLDMFGDENARMKRQKLETCVDEIRARFGKRSIYAASLMGDLHMPGDGRHEVTMPGMMYT